MVLFFSIYQVQNYEVKKKPSAVVLWIMYCHWSAINLYQPIVTYQLTLKRNSHRDSVIDKTRPYARLTQSRAGGQQQ